MFCSTFLFIILKKTNKQKNCYVLRCFRRPQDITHHVSLPRFFILRKIEEHTIQINSDWLILRTIVTLINEIHVLE